MQCVSVQTYPAETPGRRKSGGWRAPQQSHTIHRQQEVRWEEKIKHLGNYQKSLVFRVIFFNRTLKIMMKNTLIWVISVTNYSLTIRIFLEGDGGLQACRGQTSQWKRGINANSIPYFIIYIWDTSIQTSWVWVVTLLKLPTIKRKNEMDC